MWNANGVEFTRTVDVQIQIVVWVKVLKEGSLASLKKFLTDFRRTSVADGFPSV
jgi:hypothetical protein